MDPDAEHKVIYKLQDLLGVEEMGGTMRLGSYTCAAPARARGRRAIYGATEIRERHRHRYEFNKEYESCLTQGGLVISRQDARTASSWRSRRSRTTRGTSPSSSTPSSSRKPLAPHPLFADFVRASLENRQGAARGAGRGPASRWRL